jgi:hypothetical protein
MRMASFLRFAVIIVLVGAIFQVPNSVRGGGISHILVRALLNVCVLCVVPATYKVLPLPGDASVTWKRWAIAAIVLFAVLTIEDLCRFSYLDSFPHMKGLADIFHQGGVWFDICLIAGIALIVALRQFKFWKALRKE